MLRVRPGEWRAVLLLQLQIFLIIAVLLIAKPVGNAFFISRFGSEALPYAYLLTAVAAAIVSTAYAGALRYFSVLRVNLWSLGICILSLLTFTVLIRMGSTKDLVAVGLYLWVALFGVLAASQFWMMASLVFDIRQAKRLFGPIGAGAIAGGIVGGYLANIIASTFGIQALLFVAIGLLVPCLFISLYVWRYHIASYSSVVEEKAKQELLSERPHTLILRSTHLSLLCGIIALSVITAKLVDYQFSALASARFADADRLTAFFGFWFSTFNVIGLLIQLLITQRIVQRIGVSGALLFLPVGLGLGSFLMILIPGLGAAIFSRLVDGSLKQSLHRAGVEMLFLPVDGDIKGRIKTYIDVLIDSVAGGIGGLLLLLLIDGFGLTPFGISPVIFIFALLWLVFVLLIRDEYLDAFRDKLKHLRPKKQKQRLMSRHKEVLEGFLRVLSEGKVGVEENQLLYVLERTSDLREPQFREPIEQLLSHDSPAVRSRALSALSVGKGPDLFERVIPMLNDPDVRVINAALEYLITHHLEGSEILIHEQLQHPEAAIGGGALVQILLVTRGNETLRQRWGINSLFTQRVSDLPSLPPDQRTAWTKKLLKAAGRSGSELGFEFLAQHLRSAPPEILKAAIVAAGESQDNRWLLPLVGYLSNAEVRPYAISALVQYGANLSSLLSRYVKDHVIASEDMRQLPSVMEKVPSVRSIAFLFSLMKGPYANDLELRLNILRSLNSLKRDAPQLLIPKGELLRQIKLEAKAYGIVVQNLNTQLQLKDRGNDQVKRGREGLLTLLQKRKDGNLNRLFRLLGLRYPANDIIPIYRGLVASTEQENNSAVEFLDTLLEPSLKSLLIPLVEAGFSKPGKYPAKAKEEKHWKRLSDIQYGDFRVIMGGRDVRQKMAVLYLIGYLADDRYLRMLGQYRNHKDKRIRDLATKAIGLIKEEATASG